VAVSTPGEVEKCRSCKQPLTRITQLDQLLSRWWEPRRWRADLVKPNVPYLIERLWTADGQGERLYLGVSPQYTNYDIFRNMVTRLMISGIEEGWAELTFPPDPLAEDPQYVLTIVDSERFAEGVEKLFPEVNWDETVQVTMGDGESASDAEATAAASSKPARKRKKK
jgi:hypothetical protein